VPQTEIVCKSCASRKLTYQLTTLRPTNILTLYLSGLEFWMFRVFSLMFYVKIPFRPLCNQLLENEVVDISLSSKIRYHHSNPHVCFAFYSLLYSRQSLIVSKFYSIIVFFAISLCISLLYLYYIYTFMSFSIQSGSLFIEINFVY
jgi:hypothetical protein